MEFIIVLLHFTLVDKLNNESTIGPEGVLWVQWVRVKMIVNWRFIDSLINLCARVSGTEPHVERLPASSAEKPLEGDATVG